MQDIRKLLAVLMLGIAGCGGGGGSQPAQDQTPAQTQQAATEEPASEATAPEEPVGEYTVVVRAGSFAFDPTSLTVPVGTTVTWQNREELPITHTVTSGEVPGTPSGVFDMDLPQGESVQFTFDEAGTFPYYCNFHRQMTSEIVVQ